MDTVPYIPYLYFWTKCHLKCQKVENIDFFDNFGVILINFPNNKLHMSLLKSLLDTELLLNVYTIVIHEKAQKILQKIKEKGLSEFC